MSSVDSAPMSSSEVSEKGPVDFGVKAVSLKSQADSGRLLQSGGPLRTLPSPSISRQTSGYVPQHPVIPVLGAIPQKTVSFNRVTAAPAPSSSGMSSGPAITAKPPLSTSAVTSTTPSLHASPTYLLPRGSAQGQQGLVRTSLSLQPCVQTLVRTQSPLGLQPVPGNHVRAPSPGSVPPRNIVTARAAASTGKPGAQVRSDVPRPIVVPSATARPLTLTPTTQLHIATDKTMKVQVGSVAQVHPVRPTYCSIPTILQRTDGVSLQTTPVRLTPPLTPLLATQRVAVSVGTRLTMQQHVTVSGNITPSPRVPVAGVTNRGVGPPSGSSKLGVSSVASSAIITTGRLTYTTGPIPPSRMSTPGSLAPATGKPLITSGPTVVTSGSRMPLASHQVGPQGGKPRFGGVRPQGSPAPLVHSHLMVSAGNHVAGMRPALVSTPGSKVIQQGSIQLTPAPPVSKAIPVSISSPSSTPLPPTCQHTSVISKSPDVYKLASAISMTRLCPQPMGYPTSPAPPAVSLVEADQHQQQQQHLAQAQPQTTTGIPVTHRTNPSPGLLSSQASLTERPSNAPTLSTYTLHGASFFYEAPSGYQLATDSPLVARPLSPDTPLVSRQLSTEGPLIARPYTPGVIASSQAMRYNPVMIVEPSVAPTGFPVVTTASSETSATSTDPSTPAKLTSSPRPSILRKRDSDGNVNLKVVKNLNAALSGTASRSRTPSPPTPPTSLHLETNQTGTDVGPSSNGSTTISATSSPGPEDAADPDRPQEMSPRKKPRKQLLNDANDSIDMEFISEERMKKEKEAASGGGGTEPEEPKVYVKRPSNVSLLRTYKHSWKARNNHFMRYTEVKKREERGPSATELANQRQVVQRVKGWKLYHLTAQFEDLTGDESCALERFSAIFKSNCKVKDSNAANECEKEVNLVNELIMANIQRSKVIRDQMTETKSQMMKGFEHIGHVSELISKCASKRNFKKRDKY